VADHTKIPDAITPQSAEGACERFSGTARIISASNPLIHEIEDALGRLPVELA
jgi:hypothetical protein